MSNLSLKEQLEALNVKPNKENKAASSHAKKNNNKSRENAKQKPAWLESAQYGVELLKAYFPNCFKETKDARPLKIGIKQDLVKALGGREDIVIGDKACMVNSLSYYVNAAAYLKNVVEGAERIDLDGKPAGLVSAEEAKYSLDSRQAKIQKQKTNHGHPAQQLKQTPAPTEKEIAK